MRTGFLVGAFATCLLATPSLGQPIGLDCPALANVDAFPDNRRNYAPLHVDARTGWILRDGDNSTEFTLTDEAVALFGALVRQLREDTGTTLVVVVPPPRGIFAPNGVDPELNRIAYRQLIEQLRTSGAIVPDILSLLDADPDHFAEFYYKSDSHWTPNGALLAAGAVATALRDAGAFPDQPAEPIFEIDESKTRIDRRGNLLRVVEDVCGGELPSEPVEVPEIIASQPDDIANALFGDATIGRAEDIVLVGTSFSHSDDFRWPESVGYVLQRPVSNRALSGGSFQLSTTAYAETSLQRDRPEILIWEFLHYYLRTDVAKVLRDILGSVAGGCATSSDTRTSTINFDDADWSAGITIPQTHSMVELTLPGTDLGIVEVQLRTPDGTRVLGWARRVERIPVELRSDSWSLNIAQNIDGELVATGGTANVRLRNMALPLEGTFVSCSTN